MENGKWGIVWCFMNRRGFVGLLLVGLLVLVLLAACDGSLATKAKEAAQEAAQEVAQETVEAQGSQIFVTSTPEPTKEPGVVDEAVSTMAETTNLDDVTILGLTGEDWINILISVVAVLMGYLIASWIVRVVLRWLVRRTPTDFDDQFLQRIDGPIRLFVLVLFIDLSIYRLSFLSEDAQRAFNNVIFLLYFTSLFWMAWRLVGFSLEWYQQHKTVETEEQADRIEKTLPLIGRILYVSLIFIAFITILNHFNVNVTALLATLGLIGLALSLAAQDTLNDIINGVLIWLDRPFRIGDRIEIQGDKMWGDVIDIGTRSTRILLIDNSMVIVPNSVIGKNQVINYSYPDSTMLMEVDIMLDYDEDLDKARRVAIEAVRQVGCVLPDKPVDALFRDFGGSTIVFRVRWWIDAAIDIYKMYDEINDAILDAFRAAGIAVAVPKQDLKFKIEGDDAGPLAAASTEKQ